MQHAAALCEGVTFLCPLILVVPVLSAFDPVWVGGEGGLHKTLMEFAGVSFSPCIAEGSQLS